MKNLLKFLLIGLSMFFFVACEKDTDLEDVSESQQEVFRFRYKGIDYSSPYSVIDDSILVFTDKKVEKLYNELQILPELAIRKTGDLVEYFDNSIDAGSLNQDIPIMLRSAAPFSPFNNITVILYEGINYTGKSYMEIGDISDAATYTAMGGVDLRGSANFAYKASSLKIITKISSSNNYTGKYIAYSSYGVVFRDNYDYGGNQLKLEKYPSDTDGNIEISNLKNYKFDKKIVTWHIILRGGKEYTTGRDPNAQGGGSSSGRGSSSNGSGSYPSENTSSSSGGSSPSGRGRG